MPSLPRARLLNRSNLSDDVGTIAVFLNHFLKAVDLPLDPAKPRHVRSLDPRVYRRCFPSSRLSLAIASRATQPLVLPLRSLHFVPPLQVNRRRRSRNALLTTETELNAMAALAMIGLSNRPKNG